MVRCSAIKPNGERCKGRAIEGSEWCWNHDPSNTGAHRRHGARGGKRGGRGRPIAELAAIRVENAEIREQLLKGELVPGVAAVAVQSINTDIRAIGASLKAREVEEFEQRLEELEQAMKQREGESRRWG